MKINSYIYKFLRIFIMFGIIIFIFTKFDIKFTDIFLQIKYPGYIILSFFLLLFFPIVSINRWQLFLKYGSGIKETFWALWKIAFISEFIGMIFPSSQGKDIVRMALIEKKHKSFSTTTTSSSSVIIERLYGFILLAGIGLISSIYLSYPQKTKIVIFISSINIILWIALVFLTNKYIYKFSKKIFERIKILSKILGFIEKTHYSLVVFPYKKVLLTSLFLIFTIQISSIFVLYLIFLSYDIHLPFTQHLVFYPLIAILSMIPISISGLGVREGFFVYFYSLVGVAPEIAVSVSLVYYLLGTFLSIVIGGILYLLDSLKLIKI